MDVTVRLCRNGFRGHKSTLLSSRLNTHSFLLCLLPARSAPAMSATKKQLIPWASFPTLLLLLLPLLLQAKWPVLRVQRFTPRQLIYSGDYLPLLLAPWSWPNQPSVVLTRLIEAGLLFRLPSNSAFRCYALWIMIGLARTLCGFVLTRSVGWAYPSLFNHYALYETAGGLGPALVAYLGLTGARRWSEFVTLPCNRQAQEDRGTMVVVILCALLCWIEGTLWTYTIAIVCMFGVALIRAVVSRLGRTRHYHPLSLDPEKPQIQPTRFRAVFQTACVCLLMIPQPALIGSLLNSTPRYPFMPTSPYPQTPLLEIIILSYPRPTDVDLFDRTLATTTTTSNKPMSTHKVYPPVPAPSSILFTTISSYLPFLASDRDSPARLSVFTHAKNHPAFKHARSWLSPDSNPQHTNIPIEFYIDGDSHLDARPNQYLHLAEALRWAHGRGHSTGEGNSGHAHEAAEWVMVVEDDFALCGRWGWEGIINVMRELEAGRKVVNGTQTLARWGGFVATGGRQVILSYFIPYLSILIPTYCNFAAA